MTIKKLNKVKGYYGEILAELYFERKNYSIIRKNYKNKLGEIDLIASDNDELVFIEVKYREGLRFGYGYEAVDFYKMNHIYKTAMIFIKLYEFRFKSFRFDVLDILNSNDKILFNHYKNIEIE